MRPMRLQAGFRWLVAARQWRLKWRRFSLRLADPLFSIFMAALKGCMVSATPRACRPHLIREEVRMQLRIDTEAFFLWLASFRPETPVGQPGRFFNSPLALFLSEQVGHV